MKHLCCQFVVAVRPIVLAKREQVRYKRNNWSTKSTHFVGGRSKNQAATSGDRRIAIGRAQNEPGRERPTQSTLAPTVVIGPGIDYPGLERSLSESKEFVVMRVEGPLSVVLSNCRRLSPCILVIDQSDFDSLDLEEMANAIGQGRTSKVLVRVREDNEALTERVLRSGCMGVLPFAASLSLIRRAILCVDSGEYWASRKVVSRMLQNILEVERSNLTPREREILELVGLEYTNEKIANELFISPETVRWHLRSLYAKIGIHDRRAAAVFAGAKTASSRRRGGALAPSSCSQSRGVRDE